MSNQIQNLNVKMFSNLKSFTGSPLPLRFRRDLRQGFPLKAGFRVRDKDKIEDPKYS